MDEAIPKLREPGDIEATASPSKDRSDANLRFVDVLQAARRRLGRKPEPAVELRLSSEAQGYVQHLGQEDQPGEERRKGPRRDAYPARLGGHHVRQTRPAAAGSPPNDGEDCHD